MFCVFFFVELNGYGGAKMHAGEVGQRLHEGDGGICHGFAVAGEDEGAADVEAAAGGIAPLPAQVAAVAQVCIQVAAGGCGSAAFAGGLA